MNRSEVLYADEKRTIPLLRTIGSTNPIELQRSGSIGSISYKGQKVNIQGVPFSEVVNWGGQDPQAKFSVDESGKEEYNALTERGDVALGEADETFTDDDRPINFVYAVVPAEALLTSNDEHGTVNPDYPAELQPRDRGRTSSQMQIQSMSRKLNPRMLAESATAQNGAPIVRGDGAVIGGNARTQAIITAYKTGRADAYKQFIQENGHKYGLDTSKLPENPVLVRIAQGVNDWVKLAQDLNAATTAAYSTTEQAVTDAQKMDDILDLIVPTEDGSLNNQANKTFIQQFVERVVPESERGGVMTPAGLLSQRGLERAQYAIFARAYGDTSLLAKLSESLDNDAKNVTNALMDTAAAAVAIRAGEQDGTLFSTGAVDRVLKGVQIYTEAKRRGETVAEYISQASMLEQFSTEDAYVAQVIEDNKRSGKQIRAFINSLYDEVQSYGDPNQGTLFGGEQQHDGRQALEGAIRRYEQETGRELQRPDFRGDRADQEMAPEGGDVGLGAGEQRLYEDPGQSGAEVSDGDGEGLRGDREPEGLTLPKVEEATPGQEQVQEPEGLTLPEVEEATPGQEQVLEAPEPAAEDGTRDLYRPEGMTDEEYKALNERWKDRGAEDRRVAITKEERLRNITKADFIGTPALQKLGVRVENSVGIYNAIQSLIESDRAAKSIRKEMKKAEQRLHASEAERNFASGIAAGVYTMEDIPASMDADKVMELADYYWAERAVATDMIQQQRAEINKGLAEKMEELFKDSDAFKPSRAIVLNNRTPERNMLHIFGDERGAAINAAIFDPVAVNEAERFRFKNRMFDQVRTFEDSRGKQTELTKEERAIVQQVIEGRAVGEMVAGEEMAQSIRNAAENIRNGMESGEAAAEFDLDREQRRLAEKYSRWLQTKEALESGKVDQVKVENAVKKYGELFDLFYDAINDFLVAHGYEPIGFIKGYAPHIQPEAGLDLFNKALQSMGLNTDVTRLPSSIAGITSEYKPNKRWNPYFLSRTGDITQYDIATAFESYVDYMSDVLYHTDDIMRVRQAANYFRRTYSPDAIRENLEWAEELRFGSADQKAAYLRDNDVISRASAMTPADISQTMDEYVEKLYEDITKTTKYSDLVMYLDNYANILAGKQSMADRGWEYSSGRTVLNVGNRLVRIFGQAQVAGNLSSALNQTAQIPQIVAELGTRHTAEAMWDIWSGKVRRAAWWQESDFLTGKRGVNYLVTTPGEMVVSALFTPAEIMDGFVSTVAVRGRYLQEIDAGKTHQEAMKAADDFGKRVMGSRMKGSRPLAYEAKNPVSQMLHIFQVEAVNQWEHLSQDLPRDFRRIGKEKGTAAAAMALAAVIVKMLLAAFAMNRTAEELYGGTPVPFDLIGLSANFIASGEGLTTNEWIRTVIDNGTEKLTGKRLFGTDPDATEGPFDLGAATEDTVYNISNDIPFVRNAAGLLGLGDETLPIPDIYGAGEDIVNAVKNSGVISGETGEAVANLLFQLVPGGRQLSKTTKGAETLVRGGRYKGYGEKERLQYPVERDFWSVVRALMFGNSGLPETEEFYSSGLSGLSTGQTEVYKGLVQDGADPETVYSAIQNYRAINNDKELTAYEKGTMERNAIRALDLTDAQKLELYHGMTGADSRAEKFQSLMDTGLSFDRVMDAYDKYAELDADEEKKASQKATELAKWADTQDFTSAQASAVKDQLKFFSMIPTEAERYEALTGAGLDASAAKKLTDTLGTLKPDEGKESVSDMQRLRAIASTSLSERDKIAAMGTILGTEMETESGGKSQYALLNEAVERGYDLDEWLELKDAGLMTESSFRKVTTAVDFGVSTDLYIKYRAAVEAIDENGSTTQSEAKQAISTMLELTNDQKAVLWQLQNKGWAGKSNPFSTLIGTKVKEALEDKSPGLSLPTLGGAASPTAGAGDGELPGLSLPKLKE